MPNVDSRGKINDWTGNALDEKEWVRMVKGRMRKENGNFQQEPESNAKNNNARMNIPVSPSCAPINQTQDGRHDVAPGRKTEGVVSMTQTEVHATLTVSRI